MKSDFVKGGLFVGALVIVGKGLYEYGKKKQREKDAKLFHVMGYTMNKVHDHIKKTVDEMEEESQ